MKALRGLLGRLYRDDALHQATIAACITFAFTVIVEGFRRALLTSAAIFFVVYVTHVG